MSSPAELIREYLVSQGLVQYPGDIQTPGDGTTQCYVSSMPDDPDQILSVYDIAGLKWCRTQRGKNIIDPGVKLIVRALDYRGYTNVVLPITTILGAVNENTVSLNGVDHFLHSVYRTSSIVSIGEETGKRRQLWYINARVSMQDIEPVIA